MVKQPGAETALEKNETLSAYLAKNKITHNMDADNCEHLDSGNKIRLIRVSAGPKTYWYGGTVSLPGLTESDKESLWDLLLTKFKARKN